MDEIEIINKVNRAFSWLGILISVIVFIYLLPYTFSNIAGISSLPPSYFYLFFHPNITEIYLLIILTMAFISISISSIVYKTKISASFDRDNNKLFFSFFSVYISILIFSSVIMEIIYPPIAHNKVYLYNYGIQNFIFSVSSIMQMIIIELIPITLLLLIYFTISKNLKLNSFLNPYNHIKSVLPVFIIIIAGVSVFIASENIYNSILLYISTIVLTFIYLRFGFLRALLVNFSSAGIEMALSLFSGNFFISTALSIFLFIWAFLGIYTISIIYVTARVNTIKKNKEEQDREESNPEDVTREKNNEIINRITKINPNKLWIRSSCTNCGSVEFKLHDDMSLQCLKCSNVIERDAIGPYNIVINNYPNARR